MDLKAREVLLDCKEALEELNGTQGSIWRRRFITVVILLRTVGYVLNKIDKEKSEFHQEAINKHWENLKNDKSKHRIFFNFIQEERNFILKEYRINAGQSATVYIGSDLTGINVTYDYPIIEGYYKGQDQRAIILEAIQWWEKELESIEDELKNHVCYERKMQYMNEEN